MRLRTSPSLSRDVEAGDKRTLRGGWRHGREHLMSVLLSAPLGPMSPKISPALIVRETPTTAVALPNRRTSSKVSTTADGFSASLGFGASSGRPLRNRAQRISSAWMCDDHRWRGVTDHFGQQCTETFMPVELCIR